MRVPVGLSQGTGMSALAHVINRFRQKLMFPGGFQTCACRHEPPLSSKAHGVIARVIPPHGIAVWRTYHRPML